VRQERRRRDLERLREVLSLEDQTLLDLRIDQHLSWPDIADVLSHDGEAVQPAALAKRFERLKERLAKLAREKGLID
jgi:RNA polymerase sigma-70 factor (ECF subfamily)